MDAIFPIIGPAIRRAISTALAELVQSLNQTLEHTFSPQGIAWRFEAMRTGRSYGEVVLSHSLLFRVEQLFLIDRESGLLIEHRIAPGVQAPHPDMVASMMTALRDFARDSFRMSEAEGLDTLALGDLTVWVEGGPQANLAAVIRGQPPIALRQEMQQALEEVHRIHGDDLDRFRATGASFETSTGILDRLLVSQLHPRKANAAWRTWLLGGVVIAALLWFFVPRILEGLRFDRWVARLRASPGIVVSEAHRANGRFVVQGLRDPLAADPGGLAQGTRFDPARATMKWEPYIALRPEFIAQRARTTLNASGSVGFRVVGDTLVARGVAPASWIANAAALGRTIAGVNVVRLSDVADSAIVALLAHAERVQAISLEFPLGSTIPLSEQLPRLDTLSAEVKLLQQEAARARRSLRITFIGSSDSVGSEESNARLRAARAASIRAMLLSRGVVRTSMQTEVESAQTRRQREVRLRVTFVAADSLPSP